MSYCDFREDVAGRSIEQLQEQYDCEQKFANLIVNADRKARETLYRQAYDELYQEIVHHPHLLSKPNPELNLKKINRQLKLVLHFLKPDSTFVEIGPGDCQLSLGMAEHVDKVFAIDVSSRITPNITEPDNFKLLLFNGIEIPCESDSTDFVYSDQVIEHVHFDDVVEQVKSIYNSLKAGGVYLCITPHSLSGPHDISKYFSDTANGLHLKEYTTGELVNLFKSVGFSSVRRVTVLKNTVVNLPTFPFVMLECLLSILPKFLRKPICRWRPMKLLLGTKLLARK